VANSVANIVGIMAKIVAPSCNRQATVFSAVFIGGNMSKTVPRADAESVALYEKLLATNPEIKRKGATMPYTSVNGNMFTLLTPDGTLALRLPSPDREDFLERYKTTLCEQYGVVMKEYVRVPASLLRNTRALSKYLDVSYRYACCLRPKSTTRNKRVTNDKTSRPKRAAR